MEKIAFIGSYDKADLILYIAKILTAMKKKVVVIDYTSLQKTRYIVPTMEASKQYITTFQGVDVAIGFGTFEEIKKYKGLEKNENLEYDYALLDIDSYRGYYYLGVKTETKKFFVTSFDLYCLRRGLQVFKRLTEPTEVTKVYFTKEMDNAENEYLNYMARGLKIRWDQDIIYFPFETSDLNAIYNNQRSGQIRTRGLSSTYLDGVSYMVEEITGASESEVKRAAKVLDR